MTHLKTNNVHSLSFFFVYSLESKHVAVWSAQMLVWYYGLERRKQKLRKTTKMFYCFNLSPTIRFCVVRPRFPPFFQLSTRIITIREWSFAVTFYVTESIYTHILRKKSDSERNNAFGDFENRNINIVWQIAGHWFFSSLNESMCMGMLGKKLRNGLS